MVAEAFPLLNGRFPNYYELLGVSQNASKKDVNFAYKKTALREHPDKAGNTPVQNELFAAINNAKSVLADDRLRKTYDYKLNEHLRQKTTPQSAKRSPKKPPQRTSNRSGGYSYPDFNRPFEHSSHSNSSTWNSAPKPFGTGRGFGPERNAAAADKSRNTHAPASAQGFGSAGQQQKSSRTWTHATGCPLCGSQFCPGSRYRDEQDTSHIPCSQWEDICSSHSNRPRRGNSPGAKPPGSSSRNWNSPKPSNLRFSNSTPQDPFASQSEENDATPPHCTGDPNRCPIHCSAQFHEEALWKEPFLREGDPKYVDPSRSIAFQQFIPPTSAYDQHHHRGTKPSVATWFQARWRCLNLSVEHHKATFVALQLCDVAVEIERLVHTLAEHCHQANWPGDEQCHRLAAAFDLMDELMHFAAASYKHSSSLIDSLIYKQPSVAVPRFVDIRIDLITILGTMMRTRTFLDALINTLAKPYLAMGPRTVCQGIRSIMVVWDSVVLLPDNITQGCQDVFFSRTRCLENTFERKSKTAVTGYPNKPFMYKERAGQALGEEHDTWSADAEESTLRNWEMSQRTREALQAQEAEKMRGSAGWANWYNPEGESGMGLESDVDMSG